MYHPEEEEYKIYYAQALYQACLYEEAMKVTVQIENPEMNGKVNYNIKLASSLISILRKKQKFFASLVYCAHLHRIKIW